MYICLLLTTEWLSKQKFAHLRKNSIENQITTMISITKSRAMASSSYSSIVEKTLKAKHVNTIKNLKPERIAKVVIRTEKVTS